MDVEIGGVHRRLDRLDEGVQVILVCHLRGSDRGKDVHRDLAPVEQLRPRSRNPVRSLNDHREERQTRIDGDPECSFLERQGFTRDAARAFWKHEERIAALRTDAYAVRYGMSRGRSGCSIDLDDADCSHRPSKKRNPKDLLFGEESALDREHTEQQWDVVQGKMVGRHHVPLIGVNILGPGDCHFHRWYPQKHPRPVTNDPVMHRGRWSECTVHNDDRRQRKGVHEEQWHKDNSAHACDDGFDHRVSVGLMIGVYVCGR